MIYLIACSKQKAETFGRLPAKDLYSSDWFRKARAWVEATGAHWFILSSKWHLLPPDTLIESYDEYLGDLPSATRLAWARRVATEYVHWCGQHPVTILAGRCYRQHLEPELVLRGVCSISTPLVGLGIGQQKRWLMEKFPQ